MRCFLLLVWDRGIEAKKTARARRGIRNGPQGGDGAMVSQ